VPRVPPRRVLGFDTAMRTNEILPGKIGGQLRPQTADVTSTCLRPSSMGIGSPAAFILETALDIPESFFVRVPLCHPPWGAQIHFSHYANRKESSRMRGKINPIALSDHQSSSSNVPG
jgi:hypothetical protein